MRRAKGGRYLHRALRSGGAGKLFKARAAGRDAKIDRTRLLPIQQSIDAALASAEAEHSGLSRRINDVVARAAVTLGNDTDEYISRDPRDNENQTLLDHQIIVGNKRLGQLVEMISHLKFLQTVFRARFQDGDSADMESSP